MLGSAIINSLQPGKCFEPEVSVLVSCLCPNSRRAMEQDSPVLAVELDLQALVDIVNKYQKKMKVSSNTCRCARYLLSFKLHASELWQMTSR